MKDRNEETGRFTKTWNEEDERFLAENYQLYSTEYIASVLNKSWDSVSRKAKRMKLKKNCHMIDWTVTEIEIVMNNLDKSVLDLMILLKTKTVKNIESFIKSNTHKVNSKRVSNKKSKLKTTHINSVRYEWSEDMDNFLIKNHGKMTNIEISKILNLPLHSINHRIKKLNLIKLRRYSEEEIAFIKDNYDRVTLSEIAEYLNRTHSSIASKMSELSLKAIWWEMSDDKYLRDNYKLKSLFEIGNHLGRSYSSVTHRMSKLGLLKKKIKHEGFVFDSRQELDVYMFAKDFLKIDIVKNKDFYFNKKHNEWYVPDFVINGDTKVIVEYFGLHCPNNSNYIFIDYCRKTIRKIEYFSGLPDICFVDLYPKDILDNFEGVKRKLMPFLLSKSVAL